MYLELVDIISITTTVFLFSFAFFLVFLKQKKSVNILLALFVIANALYIMAFLYWRLRNFLTDDLVYIAFLGEACGFVFGPLLFYYRSQWYR